MAGPADWGAIPDATDDGGGPVSWGAIPDSAETGQIAPPDDNGSNWGIFERPKELVTQGIGNIQHGISQLGEDAPIEKGTPSAIMANGQPRGIRIRPGPGEILGGAQEIMNAPYGLVSPAVEKLTGIPKEYTETALGIAVPLGGHIAGDVAAARGEAQTARVESFLREADAVDARLRGAKTKAEIDEFIRAKEAQRAAAPDTSQKLLSPPETPAATPPAPAAPPKPVSGVPLADSLRERLGLTGEPPAEEPAPEPPQAAVEPVTPPSTQMVADAASEPITEPTDSLPVASEDALPAPRAAPKPKAPLSIAQFIARNGGLELSDETKARDYDKVFVPGGGPLARKSGLSIDGYWRTKLMEAGYFPYDPDGYSSRDIRPELDDALHQDVSAIKGLGGDRFYSENDRGRVPAKPEAISDVEAAAKQILDAHAKEGVTRDQIDTKSLYDAAELLVNGEEKDPINALERAYLQEHHNETERGDTRQIGTQIAGEGEQGIGSRPQESSIGGGENWAGFSESGKEPTDIGAEGFSQPKQASLDEFKAHIAQLKADRDAFKSEIQQAMEMNGRYKMDVNYGSGQNSLLLTKNIGELPYRVTRFDGKEPTGHFEVRNLDEAAQEMIGSRKKPPQTEAGVEGKPQLIIPGAEKVGQGELAQRAANAPLKPTVAQKPADEGLFGDAHKQKDLFGEGTPSPSTMKELGPFEHDKNAPLGGQAQKYTLDRGKDTGLEHLVAFDANGNLVAHGSGTANSTGMTPAFSNALMDPKNSIVVHHNHPSNTSLSGIDITTLTAPGLKTVWAHGAGGAVYRGELTDKAAAAFGKFAGGNDAADGYRRLYILNNAAGDKILQALQSAVNAKQVTASEANAADRHLVNLVLRDAGILDYQTNVDASGIIQKLNLQPKIDAAARAAAKDAFDGEAAKRLISDSLANDRRAWGIRHTGDLGATFGPSGEPARVNPQAGNAQARPQDDSQKVGQLGLPGIGGVRGRPVSEQLRLLEENPDYKAPPFYSAVENAVQNAKLQKGSLGQWMGYLKNQPGIKPEELDWLNLNALPQTGLITKAQMAEHVANNKVQPQEVWRGAIPNQQARGEVRPGTDPTYPFDIFVDGQLVNRATTREIAERELPDEISDRTQQTKFSHYMTPPGGDNYKEMVLTFPQKPDPYAVGGQEKFESYVKQMMGKYSNNEVRSSHNIYHDYMTAAERSEWDRLGQLSLREQGNTGDATPVYRVPEAHAYGDPASDVNRLAHVFMDDRTIDGGKSLMVKEAQSDWHSQGNKHGYGPSEPASWTSTGDAKVPDAPFKSTWPALALKHVIKHAVDNGYDSISFVTGDTVADRYDLSKHISEIHYEPINDPPGTFEIEAKDHSGKTVLHEDEVPLAKVEELVGKEMAAKIEKGEGVQRDKAGTGYRNWKTLSGLDLKVGGAFHRKLYDNIMPREANALGKKYGAKVETKEVDTKPHHGPIPEGSYDFSRFTPVHYMKITPAMREAVKTKGLPTFAAGGRVEAANIAQPTPAQAKAGNYAHDHLNLHGMPIAIETAKGMLRKGVDKNGKPWSVKSPAHYGRIKKTVGTDGDQFDVFIGPHPKAKRVWVIDQLDADTGKHDESKAFIGFPSKTSVITTYHAAFSDGRAGDRLGAITEMPIDGLKDWLKSGDMKKPLRAPMKVAA